MKLGGGGIIIDDKKRILLLKRSLYTEKYVGCWGIPGGRGEPGESPEEIAIREVKEESGLDFVPTRLYQTSIMKRATGDVKGHRFIGTYSGKIDVQVEEVDGYAWYNYEDTLKLEISFDYTILIEMLHKDNLL